MGMEREPGCEGPILQVTPRLLVVTVAATAIAVGYYWLCYWVNPSDRTVILAGLTAPFLGGWIIGLLEPRRWPAGVGITLIAIGAVLTFVIGHSQVVFGVFFVWLIPMAGAAGAAWPLRFRNGRMTRAVLTLVLCLGLGTCMVLAFVGFRLQALRFVHDNREELVGPLSVIGVAPPANVRWRCWPSERENRGGIWFSGKWSSSAPGFGPGQWDATVETRPRGDARGGGLIPVRVTLTWEAEGPIPDTESGVRTLMAALLPRVQIADVRIMDVKVRDGHAACLTLMPQGEWRFVDAFKLPGHGLFLRAERTSTPAPN